MTHDINDVLKQFEATEANLAKLERLWRKIEKLLPSRSYNEKDAEAYDEHSRAFQQIQLAMPKIDGHALGYCIKDYKDVFTSSIDSQEVGEIDCAVDHWSRVTMQRTVLAEYRFKLNAKRRVVATKVVASLCPQIESILERLCAQANRRRSQTKVDDLPEWKELDRLVQSIDTLLGSSAKRPDRWNDLLRHLEFGMKCDLNDIVSSDWPSVRAGLQRVLYNQDDPLPVAARDLGDIVQVDSSRPIANQLIWERLSAEDFERLIFNLIERAEGYDNPQWLTRTNAPDRGRDLSVFRVHRDALSAPRSFRVIIACKHWQSKSIALSDVSELKSQMSLWAPPRVDVLVIATSGRFTTDAVEWVERENQSNTALVVEMWPESHLEHLLAKRPDLIAEYSLR